MSQFYLPNNLVDHYLSELSSRVVAKSGIPSDRFHLGKIVFQCLKDAPRFVLQIDAAGTGHSETNESVLRRSIQCAIGLQKLGLRTGDLVLLMAPNHRDLCIPFYAALFLGLIVGAEDNNLIKDELKRSLQVTKPKIIFCQSSKADEIQEEIEAIGLKCRIVSFDDHEKYRRFPDLLKQTDVETFKPVNLDSENTVGLFVVTSGTTGDPKVIAHTYKSFHSMLPYLWKRETQFPCPTKSITMLSPLHWISGVITFMTSPILRITRIQSSKPLSRDHIYDMINTYKPTAMIASPILMYLLMNTEEVHRCDFSCFNTIWIGGAAVTEKLFSDVKKLMPFANLIPTFALSEAGMIFDSTLPGTFGPSSGGLLIRLVNPDTERNIEEANVTGEVWVKGPTVFKEYYNNAVETKKAFTEDGWFKTGDLFYRDKNFNFYFVEKNKLMLKYMRHKIIVHLSMADFEIAMRLLTSSTLPPLFEKLQISPVEIENVIRLHPKVSDVAVTGYPDEECGELPTAFVVTRPGNATTAQEIKDLVKGSLSDVKQLRGGVIFIDNIPTTPTKKVDRRKLKNIVMNMYRE